MKKPKQSTTKIVKHQYWKALQKEGKLRNGRFPVGEILDQNKNKLELDKKKCRKPIKEDDFLE